MIKHAMIDIETLGTSPGCIVTHVAVVVFDPVNSSLLDSLHICLSIYPQIKAGLLFEESTLKWWLNQSQEARQIFSMNSYPISFLVDALDQIVDKDTRVWSHATFDIPILNHVLKVFGYKSPFNYKRCMDIRTLQELYRSLYNTEVSDYKTGVHHNALDDCKSQINLVCKILSAFKNKSILSE